MSGPTAESSTAHGDLITPRQLVYCAICSFPVEYCEFSSKASKCKSWLKEAHPDLFDKYYSEAALEDKLSTLTVEQREAIEKDIAKKERKEEQKAEKEAKRLAESIVTIKRMERNKRKHVTAVHGLEAFGIELKPAAKFFANKFATGASVAKNPQGEDEIQIQGDVAYEVEELMLDKDDKKAFAIFAGKIDGEQIDIVEDKKKK